LKTDRILVGSVALVLIAVLVTPAFGELVTVQPLVGTTEVEVDTLTITPDPNVDVINPGPGIGFCSPSGTLNSPEAQSFIPGQNNVAAIEVELISFNLVSVHPITVNLYQGAGTGGALLGSTSNDDGNFAVPTGTAVVRFTFAAPIPVIPGNTYTYEVATNDGASSVTSRATMDLISGIVEVCAGVTFPLNDFVFATYFDPGPGPGPVGGEFIGINTVSVLVAGTHTAAAWMIPVIVSGIGFAIVIARKF